MKGPIFSGAITKAEIVLKAPMISRTTLRDTRLVKRFQQLPNRDEAQISHPDSALLDIVAVRCIYDNARPTPSMGIGAQPESFVIPLCHPDSQVGKARGEHFGLTGLLVIQTAKPGHYRRIGIAVITLQGCLLLASKRPRFRLSEKHRSAEVEYEELFIDKIENMESHVITLV
ncbi:hypothetical protein NX059_005969 [Plenodomus lindquistii]|nr:hypothetical protein NX059_005969 [Plenodomus lindquistii]